MYTSAPLPFQGQKRRHVKEFARIIAAIKPKVVIDLFGGSGLLSHVAKRAYPNSRVIYNDYDNYCERLAIVDETNKLLRYFKELLHNVPNGAKVAGTLRTEVLTKLAEANKSGYVDWITLSSSLMFSMKYAVNFNEFKKQTFYNNLKMTDYTVGGYLEGLEIVRTDYRNLCNEYRNTPKTLFIADPPYLSTDVKTYNSVEYWTLKDYLNVLTALNGLNFVYFTSNKSQIVELCEWLDANEGNVRNIFKGTSIRTVKSSTSGINSYTDIMMFKLNTV